MGKPILHIAIFIAALALIGRSATVDDIVQAELAQKGLSLGYDEERREIVAVGKNIMKIEDAASHPHVAAIRDRCHKIASLEARGKILQFLKQSLTAGRRSDFQHDGLIGSLDLATLSRVFSERVLTGWRIVASAEEYSKDLYSVAVAVYWSSRSEGILEKVKAGRIAPSDGWKDELLAHIKSSNLSHWADVRVFIDSEGFPHVLGIGLSDWDGDSRTQDVAMRTADMFARKNLMHGLYGDTAVMEAAGKWRKEFFSGLGSEVSQLRFYESLAEVCVRRALPEGCGPFHVALIENPINRRKELVSIYSFEPNVTHGQTREQVASDSATGSVAAPPSGVMVWNPNTGKFEKQE